ncbi:DUF58 domain-containing protein [Oceanibaculum indicum]|uniref:DUF58 domain-containing protein n=1 Tax=Oceanibaculum indicum P24 TaxID=1207063 RepID=K2JWX3_9PROT|nr:DUF58 domain-containing protein [Oceanibaculum indicum]EKE74789.1 hypothetical protein P24_11587 [Oceanibaculum indicum P24]
MLRQRAEQLASTLPPLLVAAERVASTVAQGVHGRRRVGQGDSFWQFRHYTFGDSVRSVDWRQSAKGDHVYVRETEWEAAQSVWLWRDASPSMRYRSDRKLPEKLERAELLLAALAALLAGSGEQVALLGGVHAPLRGQSALPRLIGELERTRDAVDVAASLPPAIPLPRHGATVWIGDFLSPVAEIEARIARDVGRGVRGFLLQVVDPAEAGLPFRGRVRFDGLEGEASTLISRVDTVRADYHRRFAEHQAALRHLARTAGWHFAQHQTDQPPEKALLDLYIGLSQPAGAGGNRDRMRG